MKKHSTEHEWLMLAAATLAGGGKAKDAISNADTVIAAFEKRLEAEKTDGDD